MKGNVAHPTCDGAIRIPDLDFEQVMVELNPPRTTPKKKQKANNRWRGGGGGAARFGQVQPMVSIPADDFNWTQETEESRANLRNEPVMRLLRGELLSPVAEDGAETGDACRAWDRKEHRLHQQLTSEQKMAMLRRQVSTWNSSFNRLPIDVPSTTTNGKQEAAVALTPHNPTLPCASDECVVPISGSQSPPPSPFMVVDQAAQELEDFLGSSAPSAQFGSVFSPMPPGSPLIIF